MKHHSNPQQHSDFQFTLPPWASEKIKPQTIENMDARMRLAITLADENAAQGGGPFGAAVFHAETHALISVGVNIVLGQRWPAGHAEIVAMTLAQRQLDADDQREIPLELVTSCEPCMMCMGASLWFGIKRIVIGAPGNAPESIGFDEGPKPLEWVQSFEQRGIEVLQGIEQERATAVFARYAAHNGQIYNAGRID